MTSIEAGNFELTYGEFNSEKMLVDTMSLVNFYVAEKKQNLNVNVDDKIPSVIVCDEKRLKQVITNLILNSVKFTPEGGNITLNIKIADISGDDYTILTEIVDTGIGISIDAQKNLFMPFEQIDGGVARKYGGTGLGLAICKQIIEQMNGKIWVESELDHGSKFSFMITVKKGEEQLQPIPHNFETNGTDDSLQIFSNRTILIAEDVEINRIIVGEMLADTGLAIVYAENGQQAIDMYKENPGKYSLILMDINMPEMDGYTATRHIRTLDVAESANIPIIAMTANVFQEDIDQCLEAGMNDHIGKPLILDEVLAKMRTYLS
jgi:CheY-like chemotaxis protein